MTPLPERSAQFDELWRELLGSARLGAVPSGLDAEDLAAEAIVRLVQDPAEQSSVPLAARGRRKVRDARAEVFRHRERRDEPVTIDSLERRRETDELGITRESGEFDEGFSIVEALTTLRQELGHDAVTYASWHTQRVTLREMAAAPGWDAQRVERARKAVLRAGERIATLLFSDEPR